MERTAYLVARSKQFTPPLFKVNKVRVFARKYAM